MPERLCAPRRGVFLYSHPKSSVLGWGTRFTHTSKTGLCGAPGYFSNLALSFMSEPAPTSMERSQSLNPVEVTLIACFPGASFSVDGALPANAPSTKMSAASGVDATDTAPG